MIINPAFLGTPTEVTFQIVGSTFSTDEETGNDIPSTTEAKLNIYLREAQTDDRRRIQDLVGQDQVRYALIGMYVNGGNNLLPAWARTTNGIVGRCTFPVGSLQTGNLRLVAINEGPFPAMHGTRFLATFEPD